MTSPRLALLFFVLGVVAVGLLIGLGFPPGDWYAGLAKPSFNPPDWLFGPVWTLLYVLIGAAGWRVWFRTDRAGLKGLWIAQMALNFAWSPAFFGARSPALGLLVILPLLAVILLFIWRSRRHDATAALLFLPYAAWVGFASALNAAILALN